MLCAQRLGVRERNSENALKHRKMSASMQLKGSKRRKSVEKTAITSTCRIISAHVLKLCLSHHKIPMCVTISAIAYAIFKVL